MRRSQDPFEVPRGVFKRGRRSADVRLYPFPAQQSPSAYEQPRRERRSRGDDRMLMPRRRRNHPWIRRGAVTAVGALVAVGAIGYLETKGSNTDPVGKACNRFGWGCPPATDGKGVPKDMPSTGVFPDRTEPGKTVTGVMSYKFIPGSAVVSADGKRIGIGVEPVYDAVNYPKFTASGEVSVATYLGYMAISPSASIRDACKADLRMIDDQAPLVADTLASATVTAAQIKAAQNIYNAQPYTDGALTDGPQLYVWSNEVITPGGQPQQSEDGCFQVAP